MNKLLTLIMVLIGATAMHGQTPLPAIYDEQERARIVDEILEERLDSLLPKLMDREGIDMWVIISREYNEDPVMRTMLPSTWLNARRRTMMVFSRTEDGIEKLAIARYSVGRLLKGSWDIDVYPDQWEALMDVIEKHDPESIGINVSKDFALADGLVHTEYDEFMSALPERYHERVMSAEKLSIAWLETRSERELEIYPMICRIGHSILQEGLSEKVIHPGITSTDDVVWWLRNRVTELGLDTWFHPTVSIQRADPESFDHLRTFSKRPDERIIQFGDLLHVDFGITYLRLNTDQQQHFYVLRPGEKEVPQALQDAFATSNRVQDILTEAYSSGKSGNEILKQALEKAQAEGIVASIYTHPIGFHGHAAGPTIGLWDQQGGVPGRGDYPLYPNTAHSIELNNGIYIKEWDKEIRIMLEEDAFFDGEKVQYIDGRQTELMVIPRPLHPND